MQFKKVYTKTAEKRKVQFNKIYAKTAEKHKVQFKENYEKTAEKRKKKSREIYQKKAECRRKSSTDRIKQFKLNIIQCPYFICVICNRSLYKRSVKLFDIEKYEVLSDKSMSLVCSLDSNNYVCNTCDKN